VETGIKLGYEVLENYDIGPGPIDVVWIINHDRPSFPLPKLRIGFVILNEYSESAINLSLARSILNLIDKLIIVVQSHLETRRVRKSLGKEGDKTPLVNLTNYVSMITPQDLEKPAVFTATLSGNSTQTSLPSKSLKEMIS
jgi:hypothetical protein